MTRGKGASQVWYPPGVIAWSNPQRQRVDKILARYPITSNKCATAARKVLGLAVDLEAEAHALVVRPVGFAIYVQPKNLPVRWAHHVTVSVSEHCVDALTGVDGHGRNTYLAQFFDHPDAHAIRPVESHEWEVL